MADTSVLRRSGSSLRRVPESVIAGLTRRRFVALNTAGHVVAGRDADR